MKQIKIYLIAFLVSIGSAGYAQYISMNTSGLAGSSQAILDLSNNANLGLLLPSVDLTSPPASPATGLIVYNNNGSYSLGKGFYYFTGSAWAYLYNSGTPPTGVTSVGLSMPSIFNVGGSPVTSTGTLAVSLANENANTVFASPSGSSGTPAFRALTLADLPTGIPNANLANTTIAATAGSNITITGSPATIGTGTITITGKGGAITSIGPGTPFTQTGTSGLTFSANPINTGNGTIALATTAVTPGTYGGANTVPTFTVNAQGMITNAVNVPMTNTGTITSISAVASSGSSTNSSGLSFPTNPITTTGNISIAPAGVTNAMLANSSLSVLAGTGLTISSGSSPISLGGTETIGLSGPIPSTNGGTGVGTATPYGVVYAFTTTTFGSTAAGTSGYFLAGNGSAAPTFQNFSSSLGGNYIQNNGTSTPQTGNFNIQSGVATNAVAVILGAASQTADILDFDNSSAVPVAKFDANGNLTSTGLNITGTTLINNSGSATTNIGTGTGIVILGNAAGTIVGSATPVGLFDVNGTAGIGQPLGTTGTPATGNLVFYNSGSTGNVNISAPSIATSYTMTLPTGQGGANTVLTDNGGQLSWTSMVSLYSGSNGITFTSPNVLLGGALTGATSISSFGNSVYNNMAFDLGTGSVAKTGTFSITNGGTAYLSVIGSSASNYPGLAIGNSTPGSNLLNVNTATANGSGTGYGINIAAQGGATSGGSMNIAGGAGASGNSGGAVTIASGVSNGATKTGGNIVIQPSSGTVNNGGVAINNTGAVVTPSALVDMASTTSGILIPRMTTAQMNAIPNPATGLEVYLTDTYCYMYWTGTTWFQMACACTGVPNTPTSASFSGLLTACAGTTQVYSITAVLGNPTSYEWIIPSGGGTILSGQGSISVTVLLGNANTTITVFALNACGSSGALTKSITINPAPSGGTLTGNASVCSGVATSYQLVGASPTTSYTWTLPTGWTSTGTNPISATPNATSGNVQVYATNSGCNGSVFNLFVTSYTPATTPTPISGLTSACPGNGAQTYICSPSSQATSYAWSISPTNANVTLGAASTAGPSNTVTFGASAPTNTLFNLTVVPTEPSTACTAPTGYTWAITTGPPAAPATAPAETLPTPGGTTFCLNTAYTFSVATVANATYQWNFPAGSVPVNPVITSTNTVQVTFIAYPTCGSLTVNSINSAGCVSTSASPGLTITIGTACTKSFSAGAVSFWQVPCGITSLTVAISGAGGGAGDAGFYTGGLGAVFTQTIAVPALANLGIAVGSAGLTAGVYGGGGGGGSFVWNTASTTIPLVVAGGGGGGGYTAGATVNASATIAATTTIRTGTSQGNSLGGNQGNLTKGNGAGGAGWAGNGQTSTGTYVCYGGQDYTNGLAGGPGYTTNGGGFGGAGGGGYNGGGGGGGYSGGPGGGGNNSATGYAGGGGGSGYNNAGTFANPTGTVTYQGSNDANGSVTITY